MSKIIVSYFELFKGLPFLLASKLQASSLHAGLGLSEHTLFLPLMFPVGSGFLPSSYALLLPLLLMGVLLGLVRAPLGIYLADILTPGASEPAATSQNGPAQ